MTEHLHSETLYRLPNFLCYRPPEFTPAVGALPALRNMRVTFGCFNNSNKITDEVVAAWSRIMLGVPGSHIFLKTSNLADQLTLAAFRKKFQKNGIEASRVECFPSFPNKYDHLMTYGEVDLALDPFPYNGTTTTFEAMWMGVPMVTLEGRVHAARVGHSILTGVGLGELVARSIPDYIQKSIDLANDLPRMAAYRARLRETLLASPLMDAKTFADEMEKAYFDMWRHAVAASNEPKRMAGTGRKPP
jgi:predicted O-linked N-acetylglucosamine transferase (SPINDLY family)